MRISDWSSDVCSSDLLGELPLQALEVDERLAELTAVQRMLARQLERVTAKRERTRTVAEPLDVEPGNLLLEPAGTEDDVLRPDIDIVEIQRVDRKSVVSGKRVSESGDLGGPRTYNKKKQNKK